MKSKHNTKTGPVTKLNTSRNLDRDVKQVQQVPLRLSDVAGCIASLKELVRQERERRGNRTHVSVATGEPSDLRSASNRPTVAA